ncbi:MAG: TRAP transporter large permease subunit [Bacteroidetes bacterium]|nr:TRAP transporter large permease subunit [Bacteroidota bacterium]MCH8524249.1 TRAP transporter large permease subunit [Balneolales bacterium]
MELIGVLVLIISFVFLLLVGVPVAFSIGIASLLTLLVSIDFVPAVTTIAQRLGTGLDSFTLLAIPFFILAGQFMNKGGIATRLIDLAKALVGMLPGGLAYVNVVSAMLFGAISGSAVAATSAIGSFMAPQMKKQGYDPGYSAAINITSSTTGLLIPPSNILIVYSLASGGVSIAALFLAGYIPGALTGLLLMFVAGYIAVRRKYPTDDRVPFREVVRKFGHAFPSLLMIIIVIGGIIAGIFTATEASAIAVLYAFVLAVLVYKEVSFKEIFNVVLDSCNTFAIVALLIGTSLGMSWVMAYENIPQFVTAGLLTLSDNPILILIIINMVLLAVGVFMDMTPAVLIFTPIFLPVAMELGMDPVHFGIMMILNLSVGLCTPPVGTVLFVGCSVAGLSITQLVRPLIPFFLAMVVALALVTYFEQLSLFLPRLFGF